MEPLTLEYVAKIIRYERPDAILPGIGGQTGLNLAMQLEKKGVLARVPAWSCSERACSSIERAEDREQFKELCEIARRAGAARRRSRTRSRRAAAPREEIGYPVVLRPAFTLGGTGGGFADNEEELPRDAEKRARAVSRCTRCWLKRASRAIRKSNTRSCATPTTPPSPSAIWKISTRSASTPATPSSSAPRQTLTNKRVPYAARQRAEHHPRTENRGRLQRPVCARSRIRSSIISSRSTPACPAPRRWPPRRAAIPSPAFRPKSRSGMTLDEIQLANTPASL